MRLPLRLLGAARGAPSVRSPPTAPVRLSLPPSCCQAQRGMPASTLRHGGGIEILRGPRAENPWTTCEGIAAPRTALASRTLSTTGHVLAATTAAAGAQQPPSPPPHGPVIELRPIGPLPPGLAPAMNTAIAAHPAVTGWVFLYHSPLYAGLAYGALTVAGVSPPPELGAAFVVHGLTRRLRLPLQIGAAALLARAWPALTTVNMTQLVAAPWAALAAAGVGGRGAEAAAAEAAAEAAAPTALTRLKGRITGWADRADKALGVTAALDRYGLAWVVGGRITGTVSLLALWGAMHAGVDLGPLLAWTGGLGETAAAWTSRWALGCLLVNFAYPLVLRYGVAGLSLRLGTGVEAWQAYMAVVRAAAASAEAAGLGAKGAAGRVRTSSLDVGRRTTDGSLATVRQTPAHRAAAAAAPAAAIARGRTRSAS
jgi:hypothetical protein